MWSRIQTCPAPVLEPLDGGVGESPEREDISEGDGPRGDREMSGITVEWLTGGERAWAFQVVDCLAWST